MKHGVVLLSGAQGAGKTTVSNAIRKHFNDPATRRIVHTMKFAEPLYKMHDSIREILRSDSMDTLAPEKIDGPLLQILGTEWGRQTRGEAFWSEYGKRRVKNIIERQGSTNELLFVFDDARFENEVLGWDLPTLSIRLQASEDTRRLRAVKWRPNTTHASETALDDKLHIFDWVFDTNITDPTQFGAECCKVVAGWMRGTP